MFSLETSTKPPLKPAKVRVPSLAKQVQPFTGHRVDRLDRAEPLNQLRNEMGEEIPRFDGDPGFPLKGPPNQIQKVLGCDTTTLVDLGHKKIEDVNAVINARPPVKVGRVGQVT